MWVLGGNSNAQRTIRDSLGQLCQNTYWESEQPLGSLQSLSSWVAAKPWQLTPAQVPPLQAL